MAFAEWFQKGEVLDYVNNTGSDLETNAIVSLTNRIGVVGNKIPAGKIGALHVEGVFIMPKATGAIELGANVYYNVADDNITTNKTGNVLAGYAVAPAAADDTTVKVKLQG